MPEVKDLIDSIQSATAAMRQSAEKWDAETKKLGEVTAETKSQYEKSNKRIDEIQLEIKRLSLIKPESNAGGKQLTEEQTAQRKAFWSWFRHGKGNMEPTERKALVEDASGLVIVPEDLDTEITRALPQLTPISGLCYQRTTIRDRIRRRSLNEVTVAWGKLEKGAIAHESSLIPSDDTIYVEDINGLTKIGKDELDDTDYNLQAHVASSFSQAIAVAKDKAIVIGAGHTSEEPEGIAIDTTLLTDIGNGKGAAAVGTYGINWTTDDTAIFEDILIAEYALPAQYLAGATWVMHRKCELALRKLRAGGYTATDGPWLWQPGLQTGQPNSIDGYPVVNSPDMGYPLDTLAKTNVIFGNFKRGYVVVDRQGIKLQRLDELYAEAGMVGFLVSFRAGGGLLRYDTFQLVSNDV
jgi:HK97 family phage major capsid protein